MSQDSERRRLRWLCPLGSSVPQGCLIPFLCPLSVPGTEQTCGSLWWDLVAGTIEVKSSVTSVCSSLWVRERRVSELPALKPSLRCRFSSCVAVTEKHLRERTKSDLGFLLHVVS